MSHYLTGVSEEHEEECRASMLHDNMDISRLMVHDQQVKKLDLRGIIVNIRGLRFMKRVLPRVG